MYVGQINLLKKTIKDFAKHCFQLIENYKLALQDFKKAKNT